MTGPAVCPTSRVCPKQQGWSWSPAKRPHTNPSLLVCFCDNKNWIFSSFSCTLISVVVAREVLQDSPSLPSTLGSRIGSEQTKLARCPWPVPRDGLRGGPRIGQDANFRRCSGPSEIAHGTCSVLSSRGRAPFTEREGRRRAGGACSSRHRPAWSSATDLVLGWGAAMREVTALAGRSGADAAQSVSSYWSLSCSSVQREGLPAVVCRLHAAGTGTESQSAASQVDKTREKKQGPGNCIFPPRWRRNQR